MNSGTVDVVNFPNTFSTQFFTKKLLETRVPGEGVSGAGSHDCPLKHTQQCYLNTSPEFWWQFSNVIGIVGHILFVLLDLKCMARGIRVQVQQHTADWSVLKE